jgi:hypothetical protein
MEYFRTQDNQIRSDFAYRIGILARQYEELAKQSGVKPEELYDGTLTIALLQALLVNTSELIKEMSDSSGQKRTFNALVGKDPSWGLSKDMITFDTHRDKPTKFKHLLVHIRNALSHPTKIDLDMEKRISTGYTTKREGKYVSRFLFIDAPDIKSNGQPKSYYREIIEQELGQLSGVELQREVREDKTDKYILVKDGAHYFRRFVVDIPLEPLKKLLQELSLLLAQPMLKEWDGEHIKKDIFEMDRIDLIDVDKPLLEV